VPSSPRDKDATGRKLGTLCRELGWSRPRLVYELVKGLHYRTFPPGHVFNWHDPSVRGALDVEASTLPLSYASASGMATVDSSWPLQEAIGIEVLPPGESTDAEVPAPAADAPAASPVPRRPSDAAVEQCFRTIMKERPDDPPTETWLLGEMKARLGTSPGRQRVRNLWRKIAAQWKRPRGHPRNFNSAKKSAV
jgi:hypothetical protein